MPLKSTAGGCDSSDGPVVIVSSMIFPCASLGSGMYDIARSSSCGLRGPYDRSPKVEGCACGLNPPCDCWGGCIAPGTLRAPNGVPCARWVCGGAVTGPAGTACDDIMGMSFVTTLCKFGSIERPASRSFASALSCAPRLETEEDLEALRSLLLSCAPPSAETSLLVSHLSS